MYGKIFASIYDGSLYGNWKALVTFQQMIVLCGPDGVIDITPQALAARTSIPLEVIQEGIAVLEAPDQYSRSPDQDGRRIERLDGHRPWGWRIVNYRRYRMMVDAETVREQNRARQQRKRERDASHDVTPRHDPSRGVTDVTPCHVESRQAEVEVEVKPPTRVRARGGALFDRFWAAYPRKASKGRAEKAFAKINPDEQLVGRMLAAIERAKTSEQWRKDGGQFIPHPATWLNDRGWENDLELGSPGGDDWLRKVA